MRKNGRRLVIDGNAVYEIDETCTACRQKNSGEYAEKHRREMAENPGKKDIADQEK